jgi:allantoate deiminase
MSDVDAARAVEGLRELARLTGDDDGAQRVAWTDTWRTALDWFEKELTGIDGVSVDSDEAGNVWATAPGESERFVVLGGHLDSVPNGGWLDGALNVVAGLEVLRALAPEPRALTLKLVSWADEEGARFGRSLLGSSACAGSLEPDSVRGLTDRDGIALPDALREHGIELDSALQSHARLDDAAAYLELHIEQGPVLERLDLPLGAVLGTFGVERHAVRFTGLHAHAGSTPMDVRRDAFLAAARSALAWREDALARDDVRATTGIVRVSPGIVTAFNGTCEVSLDQRSLDADVLADMLARAQEVSREIAAEEGCEVVWERIWQIEPIPFNPELIDLADAVIGEVAGTATRLPSGPLHDAAEMARVIPTVMLFVKSLRGLSHTKEEDTPVEDLELSVRALYELTRRTLEWAAETVDRPDAAPRHQTAGPDAPRR